MREEIWLARCSANGRQPTNAVGIVRAIQDGDVRTALQPFTHAGPWGRLIDADAGHLAERDVQAFEMGELMGHADALAPCCRALCTHSKRASTGA